MQLVNVQGRLRSDFGAFVLGQLADAPEDGATDTETADALVILPTAEACEQFERLARNEYAHCPALTSVPATTPELLARDLLKEAGAAPRLVTTGELAFVIEQVAKSGVAARDVARDIDRLSARMSRLLPGQAGFDESLYETKTPTGAFFEKHDLALWSTLPGFALRRGAYAANADGPHGARTVYVIDAQDLTPATLFLIATLVQERLVLCCADDMACGPVERLRDGRAPWQIAKDAAIALGRTCEVEEMALEPAGTKPETARVVWETVDEELSGMAAYLWKLLRENPELEAQYVAVVAPNDRWAAALADDLAANHLGAAVLLARNPLALPARTPEARDEHVALLRLRLAVHPDDELARLELTALGSTAADKRAIEGLAQLSGFSLAKAACRGLDAPFLQELLTRCSWGNAEDALEGVEARILDPSFEAGPHDIRICTPKHAGGLRGRVVAVLGLAAGLSASTRDQSAMRALQKATAFADIAVFSRPRAIDVQAAPAWGLQTERTVNRDDETLTMLQPAAAFAEAGVSAGAPLVGEQLLSGRL